ncbi:hypothetical protein AUP68_17047 [Ilyonectria robusta]
MTQASLLTRYEPTLHGFIDSAGDAMLVLEACLRGHLLHVPRTLHPDEAQSVIQSGSIFVFESQCSGMREWNDFHSWSSGTQVGDFRLWHTARHNLATDADATHAESQNAQGFLVKQAIALGWNGIQHHVISYWTLGGVQENSRRGSDVLNRLRQAGLSVREGLVQQQNLLYPIHHEPWVEYMLRANGQVIVDAAPLWTDSLSDFEERGWRMIDEVPVLLPDYAREAADALLHIANGEGDYVE